jgi:hypothetical protein
MTTSSLRACLLTTLLGACTSQHSSALDGPVDYQVVEGFARIKTNVHLELDGSASKQVMAGTGPTMMTSGTVEPAAINALRDDIAAVDLASFRDDYNCADFACGADFPVATLAIAADGSTKQIRVDRGISDKDLPAGLVKILADLDAIVRDLP